jgi:O-antigen ligase
MFKNIRLPFIVWIVVMTTLVSSIGGQLLNYNIAGLGWLIPLIISILIIPRNPKGIKFPVRIWLPWILLVLVYLVFAEAPNALQRSIMLLCPIIVGIAVSSLRIEEKGLESFRKLYRYMAIGLYIVILFKAGIVVTGILPARTALAAEAMTGTLLCSLFVSNYVFGSKKELGWWAAFAAIPYIALTRTAMVAAGLSLPVTFAPMKIFKRAFYFFIVVMIAIPLFYTERVQSKMFYSGKGTFAEAHPDNPDFSTNGRTALWDAIEKAIDEKPYFGHGANASEPFVRKYTGMLTHPHNDWLRLEYDYGYFGMGVFALSLIMQLLHILKKAKNSTGETKILFYAGASTILSFVLFMFSDNIILYAAFFGNLQFTIIGIAYAAYAKAGQEKVKEPRKYRIKWLWIFTLTRMTKRPFFAVFIWRLTNPSKNNYMVVIYARLLNSIRKLRGIIKILQQDSLL